MPSLLTEAFLLNAIVVGSVLSAGLLLVTAGARLFRGMLGAARARRGSCPADGPGRRQWRRAAR